MLRQMGILELVEDMLLVSGSMKREAASLWLTDNTS
jgi:hypothetical protein